MCGIVGLSINRGVGPQDRAQLKAAMSRIGLRGPDGSGVWEGERVLLGHTRLAIVDPDAGHQPWVDDESGAVLVYNGEIYNFPELRVELESLGYTFHSNCDTEVLLKAYLEWGQSCLERLRGIYAFAVYDPGREQLWLVRDRLGVKPLYYCEEGGLFCFASNLAALRAISPRAFRWDAGAVSHYLMTARTELGPQTLYSGVYALEPGFCLTLSLASGQSELKEYWSIPKVSEPDKLDLSHEETVSHCRDLLSSAVEEQLLRSDVPVGGFLSGGLDSAILCGEIRKRQERFTAYSIGYGRSAYNEWDAMECTAKAHELDWKRIEAVESDFWNDWRYLVNYRGCPLSTPNEIPIYRMARSFSEDCKVALTGEGADEIFGGYTGPTFCAFDYDRSQQGSAAISSAALLRAYGQTTFTSRREHFLIANSWVQPSRLAAFFPGLKEGDAGVHRVMDWYDQFFGELSHLTTFDAYLHTHARVNLEGLLNRLDSSTMAASVEGRVPFTDHRLAEFLFRLPDTAKMSLRESSNYANLTEMSAFELDAAGAIQTKILLRNAFGACVPEPILKRRKVSFPVPFIELLTGPLREHLNREWEAAPALSRLLGASDLEAILPKNDPSSGLRAWLVVNLAMAEQCHGVI